MVLHVLEGLQNPKRRFVVAQTAKIIIRGHRNFNSLCVIRANVRKAIFIATYRLSWSDSCSIPRRERTIKS